jgi:hypothetical protein
MTYLSDGVTVKVVGSS